MKNLMILLVLVILCSCRVTKTTGELTANAKHMRKVHPDGFWAAGKFITYESKKDTAKN